MPIYEIGQFLCPNLESAQIVKFSFERLKNRQNFSIEQLLMAVYCIDTYGDENAQENLRVMLELEPLEEEVLEYRMAA